MRQFFFNSSELGIIKLPKYNVGVISTQHKTFGAPTTTTAKKYFPNKNQRKINSVLVSLRMYNYTNIYKNETEL